MRVEKNLENAKACVCLSCPSYSTHCKGKNGQNIPFDVSHLKHLERLFCAFEKSNCIHEHNGCLCEHCPVYKKYNLSQEEYCLFTGGLK